ncbi:MAG: S8 family serine peptidase, partial [Alphaproteobacteria bacterium]|nr:S8 family serine peptidase [Alphaproteobacteria bacterium]
ARALSGARQEPIEVAAVSLEELLQTESFFAVGSIIAKPRVETAEPAVEPETFDVAAASAPASASEVEEATGIDTGAPGIAQAADPVAPQPEIIDSPAPPPAVALDDGSGSAARRLEIIDAPSAVELRRKDLIAPRALEKAVRQSGVRVTEQTLQKARQSAEDHWGATNQNAQRIGDEISRSTRDAVAPVPKALAVRNKINVDAALGARERAYSRLEAMGLSGVVSPEEGGQMRIVIGVRPTRFGDVIDPTRIESMRALFAEKKDRPEQECAGDPTQAEMQADPVLATECVVRVLQETGDYEYVEKDYIFTNQMLKKPKASKPAAPAIVRATPNDPLFGLQWNLMDNGPGGATGGQSAGGAGFRDFWTRAKVTGSRSVVVAVVDTGLQMSHPDIAASRNVAPGFDMVSDPMMGNDGDGRDADPNDPGDKCDPSDPSVTDTYHGTHVAGTVGAGATNNASGVAGGAWDVTLVPVRALGRCGGRLSDINDAIRWAAGKVPARNALGAEIWNANPADVINLSIGLFEPCPASMQAAINDAVAAGAIVVAAAGNARIDTKYYAPGGCQNVVSVAAGDARGMLTPYSNYGPDVDILAPGGDMTRDDDGDGRPDGILSTKFARDCYDPAKPGAQVSQCFYAYENGTSMAAPHVTAALALLKSKFPAALPSELRAKLMSASTARTPLQCSGKCANYPGSEPIPGQDGMCFRPCGGAMLNLGNASVR